PFDGLVTVRHREPGEIVPAGSPVLTLINPGDRWVRIYIKEDRVGKVRLGSRATITSDTFPGKSYPGEVAFIASEAEFTPKNVQTTEERVKLVYAVKVRIVGDADYGLKPGLPADVRLEEGGAGSKGAVAAWGGVPFEALTPLAPLSQRERGEQNQERKPSSVLSLSFSLLSLWERRAGVVRASERRTPRMADPPAARG